MQPTNIQIQLLKAEFSTHLYSPRTTYSNYLKEIQQLKTNMIINIDKYILGNLKTEFEKRNKELTMVEFMYFSKKFLKEWNPELEGREVKIQECLNSLWEDIDRENRGKVIWEEFNSKIIETSLNLKSLSNNAGIQAPTFSEFVVPMTHSKHENPISKIVCINKKHKMAYFRDESTTIEFFPTESSLTNSTEISQTKPLLLPQQELKVETMIKVKEKSESQSVERATKGLSKIIKKDVKVSSYKNTVLDAIYISDSKYDMLIVSCSDKHIRGYNVENLVPVIACQPENEDEPMVHQFPVEIYNMTWDEVNEVLYGTGKGSIIYQWLVKTDSEREMFDSKSHDGMVSTIFMMPKLQLLATGGFDGKLVLWDTVGQSVKIKYEEHTRAISAITFHEGLVLLFTSALDHKVCVWNPYIGSLIHKIDNALNVIQLDIIPNTSYLMSVDNGGNVKVREINRFTQIVSFSIFRSENADETEKLINSAKPINSEKEKEIMISMCSKKDNPIMYYFGTERIIGYRFNEIEKTSLTNNSGAIVSMKYYSKIMKLYTPIRNHIIVWNMLTGINEETFYDMTENDITAFELVEDLGFFLVGDMDGSIIQRKINNGSLISRLSKMKSSVTNIKFYELEKNEGQKNPHIVTRYYHSFCTTEEGDIAIHKCTAKGEFEPHRHFSLRHDFSIQNANITAIEYFRHKNIIIVALSTNEIICIDVEKRSLLVKISLGDHFFRAMDVVQLPDKSNFLLVISKHGQLIPFYLPPHNKKFKNAPLICTEIIGKIDCSIYASKTHKYIMCTENQELFCFEFDTKFLDSNQSEDLHTKWHIKLEQRVVEMLLIESEEILILLNQTESFTFVSIENGQIICELSLEDIKREFSNKNSIEPILYFKSKTNEILLPTKKEKIVKIETHEPSETEKIKSIIDPYHFITLLEEKSIEDFNKLSNPSWKLNLNIRSASELRIKTIESVNEKINSYSKDLKGLIQNENRIEKALELQKKWEKEKDNEQEETENNEPTKKINSLGRKSTSKYDIKAFDKMMASRGNSLSSLWKNTEKPKKYSEFSVHTEGKVRESQDVGQIKKFNHIEQIDLSKLQKDPLYRLGLALKSVNTKDRKAENFIELAKKKEELKLPKISSQKMKL